MRTAGVVVWFDRSTGTGEVVLEAGGERVRVRRAADGEPTRDGAEVAHAAGVRGPDVAAAYHAGTWGDGGRDY
ncbi:hypothetical protein tb265_22540 [Gemmatimonadetes bacterium T265]|nr:hypothetical protein tb265_22540 [Gemmatimonadetes bacterium T265]